MLDLQKLFNEAYKTKAPELNIICEIKARVQTYSGSKEALAKPYSDEVELQIINKIKKEHEESMSFYKEGTDGYNAEKFAIEYLSQFLPKPVTDEEVKAFALTLVKPGDKSGMRQIGVIKKQFPTFDGTRISEIVKDIIG